MRQAAGQRLWFPPSPATERGGNFLFFSIENALDCLGDRGTRTERVIDCAGGCIAGVMDPEVLKQKLRKIDTSSKAIESTSRWCKFYKSDYKV